MSLIVDTNNRITESVLLKLKSLQLESERRLGMKGQQINLESI